MFGWDAMTHFAELIKPKWRYLGDIKGLLKIEQLHRLYQITAYNLLKARECYIKDQIHKQIPQPHLQLGDAVLVRDHARDQFRPCYKDYRITKRLGNARVEVSDNHGKLSVRYLSDVKKITPWIILYSTFLIVQAWVTIAHSQLTQIGSLTFNGKQWIGHYWTTLLK